jgi:hypothetical protein
VIATGSDVAGRSRGHRDGLLVSDDCQNGVEHRELGLVGGRPQPALVEQRREPQRLQGDRLAAGVGPRDHEGAEAAQIEVDRNRRRGVEQGMAGASEHDPRADRHLRPAPRPGEGAAGEREIDLRDGVDEHGELRGARADRSGELSEDPGRLVPLGALRLAKPVGVLDHGERLDEERLP